MKTLLIMRHGKSSWKHKELEDHERPLSKRGLRDSHLMGEVIHEKELIPQVILVSSAVRTTQTAQIFCESIGYQGETTSLDSLYLAESDGYIAELKKLPDSIERAMIIGHNPGLEYLLQELSGQIEALTTSVIAFISLSIDHWADLDNKSPGELIEIWHPKELREVVEEEEEAKGKAKEKAKEKEKPKKEKTKPRKNNKKK
jgi:phosphohistidine phosphatase